MAPKKSEKKEVQITAVERGLFEAHLLGRTPIILNRIAPKGLRELLYPKGPKTQADRQANLKHDPLHEYRAAAYRDPSPDGPTELQIVAAAVKLAAASIPLDMPDSGTSKAQLGRLVFAPEDRVPLYGVPQMLMSVVRCADKNRTPDVRTRVIVPRWAARVTLTFVRPILRYEQVANLVAAGGFMRGIGDWRAEKGNGNYGEFELVDPNDPRYLAVIENGGRQAQLDALNSAPPVFYDLDTEELYTWFVAERERRGQSGGNGVLPDASDDDDADADNENTVEPEVFA